MFGHGEAVPALVGAALWIAPGAPSQLRVREWSRPVTAPATRWRAARISVPAGAIALGAVVGWAVAAGAAIIIATALHVRSRRAEAARARRECADLSAALDIVIAELRSGAHPGRACGAAAAHIRPGPVAVVLSRASAQALLGGSVPRVLAVGAESAAEGSDTSWSTEPGRVGDPSPSGPRRPAAAWQWQRIAAVWSVAERRGVALAGLLDAARADLVTRESFSRRAEAGLAGARSTATVLASLPLVGIAFGQLMGAAPLRVLTGGGIGPVLLLAGVVFDCAGLLWAERVASGAAR